MTTAFLDAHAFRMAMGVHLAFAAATTEQTAARICTVKRKEKKRNQINAQHLIPRELVNFFLLFNNNNNNVVVVVVVVECSRVISSLGESHLNLKAWTQNKHKKRKGKERKGNCYEDLVANANADLSLSSSTISLSSPLCARQFLPFSLLFYLPFTAFIISRPIFNFQFSFSSCPFGSLGLNH